MSRPRELLGVRTRRSAYTWVELVVVLVVLAVVLALGVPALMMAREAARRASCCGNLKQIALAVHNYAQANKVFPQGTICLTDPISAQHQYDAWGEAAKCGPNYDGTSFFVRIMPFITGGGGSITGGVGANTGVPGAAGPVANYVNSFYCHCPSRRDGLRPGDSVMMLASWWPEGGTDYGGCVGRHVAYDTTRSSHSVLDAGAPNAIVFDPGVTIPDQTHALPKDDASHRWGVFGRVNVSTRFAEIRDGTSNTVMTGELQRIVVADAQHGGANNVSHDGWAVGGDATGFTTGYGGPAVKIDGKPMPLMNNGFFQSPGSDHPGGANFGMGDGSVRFISTSFDANIFALLGSMDDGVVYDPISVD